ncbi:hypothetical protein E1B28_004503 [Marasmius oreades]|uniref:Uncharacterized protein n=1 Tax=Marasmius oreades TaxID=181124 RepID=A0A9P8ADA7_9AGAR|nr:uncharacterized protein E1B28_004503 [Marasmius oreades]KAG7097125.1 hypothetical protein E1B28_004503 [Marasmius oreades]
MPRILPRLIKKLAENPPRLSERFQHDSLRANKISLRRPVPTAPSFNPEDYPKSILISSKNPVSNSGEYIHHKSLPPRICVGKRVNTKDSKNYGHDAPREMTEEERGWWSSPYLRMLASPIRRCLVTGQYLPSDFLVRLSLMKLPSSRPLRFLHPNLQIPSLLVPDGLQHPKFQVRRSGTSVYMLCSKAALVKMKERSLHQRFGTEVHAFLGEQIRHLLRLRVLQELQLVYEQLRFRPRKMANQTLIRRLTRSEWKELQSSGVALIENAIAILVVPPVNRDHITKARPEPSMASSPPSNVSSNRTQDATSRPISVFYPASSNNPQQSSSGPKPLAAHQIPLYHSGSMFPEPTQRAALHKILSDILTVERRARYGTNLGRAEEKPSHAFALLSNEVTIQHADIAAVGVALWRVRMFEGLGCGGKSGWMKRTKYRSVVEFE